MAPDPPTPKGRRRPGHQDLAPVGPLDTATLTTQIQGVTASGYNPIGNALKAAAADLDQALPTSDRAGPLHVASGEYRRTPPAAVPATPAPGMPEDDHRL
jgi:hypothetical protein